MRALLQVGGRGDRGRWPVRIYALGSEPPNDLSSLTTAEERVAMVESLSFEAFTLTGRAEPRYRRTEAPVVVRRLGE